MFRYKQSSLWFRRYGVKRWRKSNLLLDMRFRASVSFDMSGRRCGQTGANWSAILTPDHIAPLTGGMKRRLPTGGAAYGMPLYTSTAPRKRSRTFGVTMVPMMSPYLVCTTRVIGDDEVTHDKMKITYNTYRRV